MLLVFLVVLLFSCQGSSNTDIQTSVLKNVDGDTLEINAPVIIFFSISDKEYKAKALIDKDGGIHEVLSDFNYYSKMVVDSMKDIKFVFSNSAHFKIKRNSEVEIIDRDTSESYVGVILADSIKAPIINYGVSSYVDYKIMIENYFKR